MNSDVEGTPAERVAMIFENTVGRDLSSWERHQFLPSIEQCNGLSTKQEHILRGIEQRIFGDKEK